MAVKRLKIYTVALLAGIVQAAQAGEFSVDPQAAEAQMIAEAAEQESDDNDGQLKATTLTFGTESVLKSGTWVKVSVTSSGMKKLTQQTLSSMGFSDMTKVSVYGNGGSDLPFKNNTGRIDDLVQLPVLRLSDGILFYAEGVETWSYNSSTRFTGALNTSSSVAYYYVTDSGEASAAPETVDASDLEASETFSNYDYRIHYKKRETNLLKSGRDWWSDAAKYSSPTRTLSFTLPTPPSNAKTTIVATRHAARNSEAVDYTISVNGTTLIEATISESAMSSTTGYYARAHTRTMEAEAKGGTNTVTYSYVFSTNTSAMAWVDYVTLISDAVLDMGGDDELLFRQCDAYTTGKVSEYVLSGAQSDTRVWDITTNTAPQEVTVSVSGQTLTFKHQNKRGSEFVAFNPSGDFDEPTVVGTVANQNLHAMSTPDYIIIAHDDFLTQAQRVAEAHRTYSGLTVEVATTSQIYNEFAAGKPDVSAIRNFIRMLYLRGDDEDATTQLHYALLFGCGTYDNMSSDERNKIPTYQSEQSLYQVQSYVTDDFFGWLDAKEGDSDLTSKMDIAIGRIPAVTTADADAAANKVEVYLSGLNNGIWRKKLTFVADNGDSNEHLNYADKLAVTAEELNPDKNIKKIYQEAYSSATSSTGVIYQQAIEDFASAFNDGSLLINYMGHGGATALTDESLFKQAYISSYSNLYKLPFFMAGTCDFAPFDNHGSASSGEELVLHAEGGCIGVFTSTRLVYSDSNYRLLNYTYSRLFQTDENGRKYSIGDAVLYAKQETYSLVNSLKYVLLCDPAIVPADQAEYGVATDSINGVAFEHVPQIAALEKTTIEGSIRNDNDEVVDDFNGTIDIILYDKRNTRKTTGAISSVTTFEEYASVLYNGEVEVTDGRFEASLSLSKDIDLSEGYGRLSYYAWNEANEHASGYTNEVLIGGITMPEETDTVGPEIDFWVNYAEFTSGSTTGSTPVIYATLSDSSSINISGLGIGHDISLVVDDDRENATSLNSYFSFDTGSSTSGSLTYSLSTLTEGTHTLTLKAWDNLNNSSSKTITIVVAPSSHISFGRTELYPQPYRPQQDQLKLRFSHNDGGSTLTLHVNVLSLDGRRLAQCDFSTIATLTQTDEICLSDQMPQLLALPNGHYVLHVKITSSSGRTGSFAKKLTVYAQ